MTWIQTKCYNSGPNYDTNVINGDLLDAKKIKNISFEYYGAKARNSGYSHYVSQCGRRYEFYKSPLDCSVRGIACIVKPYDAMIFIAEFPYSSEYYTDLLKREFLKICEEKISKYEGRIASGKDFKYTGISPGILYSDLIKQFEQITEYIKEDGNLANPFHMNTYMENLSKFLNLNSKYGKRDNAYALNNFYPPSFMKSQEYKGYVQRVEKDKNELQRAVLDIIGNAESSSNNNVLDLNKELLNGEFSHLMEHIPDRSARLVISNSPQEGYHGF